MRVVRWARLQAHAACGLRLGAWYPVTGLTAREAQVQVRGRVVTVARSLLELRSVPPQQWTVVPPGVDPTRPLAGRRDGYVVCPSCRHREATPESRVPTLRCARCNAAFTVGWDEQYPGTDGSKRSVPPPSPPPTLASDNRMTRRRLGRDRRVQLERRTAERRVWPTVITFPERRITQRRCLVRRSGRERRSGLERRQKAARW
jgi:hypothetical protein